MPTPDPFVKEWKANDDWNNPEYSYLFPSECVLKIDGAPETKTHTLTWTDGHGHPHAFPFGPGGQQADQLTSQPTDLENFSCIAILIARPDKKLGCQICKASKPGKLGEGPVGTFSAEADDRKEDLDASPLEESIAVW
jgi:hypothetical protein